MTTKLTARLAELLRVCEAATPLSTDWDAIRNNVMQDYLWGVNRLVFEREQFNRMQTTQPQLIQALLVAAEALEGFSQPCTRQDFTVAKLDEVIIKLAEESLTELEQILCPAPEGEGK